MKLWPALVSVLMILGCAPGEKSTRTAANEVRVPVHSCVGTRIAQTRHCKAMRSVSHPSELIGRPKVPTISDKPGTRRYPGPGNN